MKIAVVSGGFDPIHSGHIDYLRKASTLGDKFILAINSDNSIRKLKGENRPYNNIYKRVSFLEKLEFIDVLFIFEDDTPIPTLKKIKPDVLVKGGDYKSIKDIVGYQIVQKHGGDVMLIKKTIDVSTTEILKRIS